MNIQSKVATTSFAALIVLGVIVAPPVSAQTLDAESTVNSEVDINVQDIVDAQENADVSVQTEVDVSKDVQNLPSNMSLFFQGIKEKVSLMFTFDPVKEAEKRMFFAEKRLELAEKFAKQADKNSDKVNDKKQEKAKEMLLRAHTLVEPIEALDVEDELSGQKLYTFVDRFAEHHERRQQILEKVEAKFSSEQAKKMDEVRVEGRQNFDAMMKVLDNKNLPDEVREHLIEVRARIQTHAEAVMEKRDSFRTQVEVNSDVKKEQPMHLRRQEGRRLQVQEQMHKKETSRNELPEDVNIRGGGKVEISL